ncbi:S-layer homology domain-containing protein [Kineosporiaceae bacterium SCSIO 59966]|nr:S-layer homology domain-containing protein [Kineosporiaceae bacterium SCSIO 59966]
MSFTTRQGRAAKRSLAVLGATALTVGAFGPAAYADNHVQSIDPACADWTEPYGFDDITGETQAYQDAINCLAWYDITRGRNATTYAPDDDVKRYEMALFISRTIGYIERASDIDVVDPEEAPDAGFEDTDGLTGPQQDAIDQLVELEIVEGKNADEFAPYESITRRDMARFIDRMVDNVVDGSEDADFYEADYTDPFADVPPTLPGAEDIYSLRAEGIVQGEASGLYLPYTSVDRKDMAFYVMRTVADLVEKEYIEPLTEEALAPAALSLTPEEAVNPVGTEHTVTATLVNADGGPVVDGSLVRFEVYGSPDEFDVPGQNVRLLQTGGVVESEGSAATFTYTDDTDLDVPEDSDDYIVACVVAAAAENCTEEQTTFFGDRTVLVVDQVTGEPTNIDAEPSDWATKAWEVREAASMTLEPAEATNVLSDEHTVTATVYDQFDEPLEGETVTFEVYRDFVEDEGVADTGFEEVDTTGATVDGNTTAATDGEVAGEATFTYTGPDAADAPLGAEDLIVACIDGVDADVTCVEYTAPTETTPGTVTLDDDEINATATKSWVAAELAVVSLTPETAVNPEGTDHTVVATVENQFGEATVNQPVTFQVFSVDANGDYTENTAAGDTIDSVVDDDTTDVDETGTATFTYTGAAVDEDSTDVIVACLDTFVPDTTDPTVGGPGFLGCADVDPNGNLVLDEADDTVTAEKTWVALNEAPADGTYTGDVVGTAVTDGAGGSFNLFTTDEQYVEITYVADDLFRIAGEPVTEADFEEALSEGDAVSVVLNTSPDAGAQSVLNLVEDRDAVPAV